MKSSPSAPPSPPPPASSFDLYPKNRCCNIDKLAAFFLTSLVAASIFSLALLYSPNPFKFLPQHDTHQKLHSFKSHNEEEEKCDLFKGHWVREIINGSLSSNQYTNSSCVTIPDKKNCFRHGREDKDFLNWRWKPDRCDLPRFDPKAFLEMVRGKTMGFVGDSVARNHMDSLVCLLSRVEVPVDVYKDAKDRNRIYVFPGHNFTLRALWTKYLVVGEERVLNGSQAGIVDLKIDKIDDNWAKHLHNLDYVIISSGQWFFRPMYIHEGPNVLACVYCQEPNVADLGVQFALQMGFRAALSHINRCEKCNGLITLLRTYSPSHFENGAWNTGGTCNRTSPFAEEEISLESLEWELRNAEAEEIERVTKESMPGKKFGILDITRAMLMRPDGHPGAHWRDKEKKGYNDCVHWCLPGPIDSWSDFLLAGLGRLERAEGQ